MEDNELDFDSQLADLTEQVLAGTSITSNAQTKPYVGIVENMKALTSGTPSPEFRNRLTDVLNKEWDAAQRVSRQTSTQTWARRSSSLYTRLAALLIVLIGLGLLVLSTGVVNLNATAIGGNELFIVSGALIIGALVAAFVLERRKP